MNTQTLEIFKAGSHTAMSGVSLSFSEADLQATAAAYDPALHEAPLVVGHPRNDAPAYGWVRSLSTDGQLLQAAPGQVDADFAEAVNAGRFKKVSASFYTPDSPSNPVPGVYYLRHVGFLGAQAPAVKGLKSASFSDSEEGVIEFGDWDDRINASLWRTIRDWILAQFGQEAADRAVPGWNVDQLQESAAQPEPEDLQASPAFSEPDNQSTEEEQRMSEDLAAREAAIKQQEAEFAERENRLREREAKARRDEYAEFCDGLVKDGRLLPVHKLGMVEFMAALDDDQVIEFGEGTEHKKLASAAWLKSFLTGLPKQVEFGEVAKDKADAADTVSFSAPSGYSVDREALEIHTKALAYQASNPNTTYTAAVAAVSQ